jgi:hypothetical protein
LRGLRPVRANGVSRANGAMGWDARLVLPLFILLAGTVPALITAQQAQAAGQAAATPRSPLPAHIVRWQVRPSAEHRPAFAGLISAMFLHALVIYVAVRLCTPLRIPCLQDKLNVQRQGSRPRSSACMRIRLQRMQRVLSGTLQKRSSAYRAAMWFRPLALLSQVA